MALNTTGLLETLTAASSLATQALKYRGTMLEIIFKQLKSETGAFGETLNINVPRVNEGDVVDIGGGALQPSDEAHDTYPIRLDKNESVSFVVKDWDKARTPADLKELYVQPKMEALLRKVNRRAVQLLTFANFNRYTAPASAQTYYAQAFAREDFATGWGVLDQAGVPTDDGHLSFVTNSIAYANTLKDKNMFTESIVGVEAAVAASQRGVLAPQFNLRIRRDQQMPQSATTIEGVILHDTAIGMVTAAYPRSEDPSVKESISFLKPNIPIRLQAQYSLRDQGTLIHMHCIFGMAMIRPEYAYIMQSSAQPGAPGTGPGNVLV